MSFLVQTSFASPRVSEHRAAAAKKCYTHTREQISEVDAAAQKSSWHVLFEGHCRDIGCLAATASFGATCN